MTTVQMALQRPPDDLLRRIHGYAVFGGSAGAVLLARVSRACWHHLRSMSLSWTEICSMMRRSLHACSLPLSKVRIWSWAHAFVRAEMLRVASHACGNLAVRLPQQQLGACSV